MPLVAIGALLFLLKLAELGPTAAWSWWVVLAPFGLAAVWWQVADSTGYTQRKAIEKMEKRKVERRDRALEALDNTRRTDTRYRTDKQVERARMEADERRVSADPTQADRSASEDQPPRRDVTR